MIQRWEWPWAKKTGSAPKTWQGKAGKQTSAAVEAGKPAAAIGTSATVAGLTAGATGVAKMGGPAGSGALGALMLGDAALGLYSASGMDAEARTHGDQAMQKLAGRKAKDQGAALGIAATGTARAGVDLASAAGSTGLAAASGALGVAGGGALVLQGAWRGGQAVMKLCRLTWQRGQRMLSSAGQQWKTAILGAEKFKATINALKIAAGALGIAAGALFIVGSPVGWAVGLAAALAGGIYAAGKIAGKISNARDKDAAKQKLAQGGLPAPEAPAMAVAENWDMAEYRRNPNMTRARGQAVASAGGAGFVQPTAPVGPDAMQVQENWDMAEYRRLDTMARPRGRTATAPPVTPMSDAALRKQAIEKANAVAREASVNARVAAAMRTALGKGSKDTVYKALEIKAADNKFDLASLLIAPADQELHDAYQLLTAINVNPDQALADSGQELIEKKLSKAEGM